MPPSVDSDVKICNMALANIGQTQFIADFTDQTKEAQVASLFYAMTRDELLEAFPWPFAMKRATLTATTSTRNDWANVYTLPTDCIAPRSIFVGATAQQIAVAGTYWPTTSARSPLNWQRIPFDLDQDASGATVLLCDAVSPELHYTAQITDVTRFPPAFVEALAWALAVKFAMPMSVRLDVREQAFKAAQLTLNNAIATASRSRQEDPEPNSEFIQVRG